MALRRLCAASSCGMPSSRLRLWVRARLVVEQGGWGEALGGETPLLVRARPGGGVGRDSVLPARAAAEAEEGGQGSEGVRLTPPGILCPD